MEHQRIAVGILEPCLPADARRDRLAVEHDPLRLELGARGIHVGNAKRQARGRRRELLADARRVEDVERHLSATKLHVALALGLDLEPERLGVELLRPLDVSCQNGHEVDALDVDQRGESPYGAYRLCSTSWLPSGSKKVAMWQTPLSKVSPTNSTPFASNSARAASTSSTRRRTIPFGCGLNSPPKRAGSQIAKHVSPTQNSFHACSSGRSPSVST